MLFRIETKAPLQLAIAPRPRGGDWLEDDLRMLRRDGVDVLVSLLTVEETRELGLIEEQFLSDKVGIEFHQFPIPDRAVPQDTAEFLAFIDSLQAKTREGKLIAAHCRACIGRSSLFLAVLMRKSGGFTADQAFDLLSRARGLTVPDTPEQRAWVASLQFSART